MQRRKWLSNVRKSLFGFEDRFTKRQELERRFQPRLEALESRVVPATVRWVDNNPADITADQFTSTGGSQPALVTGLTPGVNLFSTISAAVAAASAGDTINVSNGVGSYSEAVAVNKTLTIDGNQFGVDARTRSTAFESVVDGTSNGGDTPFDVTANNVVIDGFTIQGATNSNVFGFGIVLGTGTSGAHVVNNIIQNNIAGLSLANTPGGNQALIQYDLFQNNNAPGPVSGTGIYTDEFNAGGNLDNVLVDSDTFTNNDNEAVVFGATTDNSFPGTTPKDTHVTISNNDMDGNGGGVFISSAASAAITGNSILNSTAGGDGIFIAGGVNGLAITNNNISGNAGFAINVGPDVSGGSGFFSVPNTNVTASENSFANNTAGAVSVTAGRFTGTLNASGDWWNTAIGANPTDLTAPFDIETITSGAVHVGSFLDSGTNAAIGNGFTPAAATENWVPVTSATSGLANVSGVIQDGINSAVSGMTVRVAADTYAENDLVTKPVMLLGANAGIDPNPPGSRVTETIVEPGLTSSYDTSSVFVVQANNVTIDGFTIQGSIASPPVGQSAGFTLTSGTTVYAAAGVSNSTNVNTGGSSPSTTDISNLTVQNDIIQDFTQVGVYGDTSAGAPSTGNTITANLIQDVPNNGQGGYYGEGVIIYDNFYADVTANTIQTVRTGIQTGNNYLSAGVFAPSISNNSVSAYVKGIYFNLQYSAASTFTVSGNTITQADGTVSPVYNVGLLIQSIQSSVQSVITGNNVSGFLYGVEFAGNNTTNTVTVQGGTLNDNTYGVWDTNNDYFYPANYATTAALNDVSITNSTTAGIWVDSTSANSGGMFDTTDNTSLAITNGTSVTNGAVGLLVAGAHSLITGNTLNNTAFAGQSGNYITLASGALAGMTLDATGVSFSGTVGNSLTLPQAFAVEDLITDAIDATGLGFVRIQTGHVFVTPNSFLAPATDDTGAIQRTVNAASALDTVNVEAGTYYDNVSVNKSLTLLGANSGIDPNLGTRVAETIVEPAVTNVAGTDGTIFRVGSGAGHVDVTINGFTVNGDNPNLTGGLSANGAMIDTGAGIVNSVSSFDTNPGGYDARMTVDYNIIENLERYGVLIDSVPAATAEAGNIVSYNKIDNIPFGNNFTAGTGRGRGVAFEDNIYGTVSYNVMTRVNVGWQDDNYYLPSPGAGTLVDHNTITTYHRGIFHNLQYDAATAATISNNQIFVENVGDFPASSTNFGLELISIESAVGVTVTNNSDTGNVYGVILTGDTTTAGITVSGGTLSGNTDGVYVTDNDPQFPSDGNTPNAVISGVTITGATDAGVFVQAVNGEIVGATLTGGTSITGSAAAVKGTGFTTLTLANVSSSGNTSGGSITGTDTTVNITPGSGISVSADDSAKTFGDGSLQTISYAGATLTNLNLGTSSNNNAFTVKPVTGGTTIIAVDGGTPFPLGNTSTLSLNLSAVTNPVITSTGPGAGNLTATPAATPLSWMHISQVTPSPAAGVVVNLTQGDNYRVFRSGAGNANLEVDDVTAAPVVVFDAPYAGVSSLTLDGTGTGVNQVNADFVNGNAIPAGGLIFNGVAGTNNLLKVSNGVFTTVTNNFTGPHAGNIVFTGFGTITYTGLQPVDLTGSTAGNQVFNLPSSMSSAFLEDNGTSTQLRSNNGTFETTSFSNPTTAVTINPGTATDTLTVTALPHLMSTLNVGTLANPFATVNLNGAVNLISGSLTVYSGAITSNASGSISTSGAVLLNATGAITLGAGINAGASTITIQGAQGGAGNFTQNAGSIVTTNATASAVSITVGGTANATVATITAGGGSSQITVNAGGSILDTTGGVLTASSVTLTAGGEIGQSPAAAHVDTATSTLTASAGTTGIWVNNTGALNVASAVTTSGVIVISASGTLTATSVTAGNGGNIELLTTAGGNIAVGLVTTTGAVALSAAGAITDPDASSVVDLLAASLEAVAGTGIGVSGTPLNTSIGNLAAGTTAGGVFLTNTGAILLTITTLSTLLPAHSGVSAVGNIVITTSANLTVLQPVASSGGSVHLTGGAGGAGNTITVNANVTGTSVLINGGAGADVLILNATGATPITLDGLGGGDSYFVNFNFNAGASAINAQVNVSDSGTVGTDNLTITGPNAGSTFTVSETQTTVAGQTVNYSPLSPPINADLKQITIVGGPGNDTFNVSPSRYAAMLINGGPPSFGQAGVPPGDTLNFNALGNAVTVNGNTIITNGGTPAYQGVSFEDIESLPFTPLGTTTWDFNFVAGATSPVQPGYTSVLPTRLYGTGTPGADYGWVSQLPSGGFDRGAISTSPQYANLLRDGVYGSYGAANARTYRADVANGYYLVSVKMGDIGPYAHSNMVVTDADTGQVVLPNITTAAGQVTEEYFVVDVTTGHMNLTFSTPTIGNQWLLEGLDIRPAVLLTEGLATQNPGVADGVTVDSFTITHVTPNAELTVSTTAGTIVSADADTNVTGVQVLANGAGQATVMIQRPTGGVSALLSYEEVSGAQNGLTVINYTQPSARLFDFNAATSPTQTPTQPPTVGGYVGVQSTTAYAASLGYGWVTLPVGSFDRGAVGTNAFSNLIRDGVYGTTAQPATFRTDLPNGNYIVTVTQGDQIAARNNMYDSVITGSGPGLSNINTAVGQFAVNSFPVTVSNGELQLQFGCTGIGFQWVVNGLDIRPAAAVSNITFTGSGAVPADGMMLTTITGHSSLATGTLVTVSTSLGTIVSADQDPNFAGTQVTVGASGMFTFQIMSPLIAGTPTLTASTEDGSTQGTASSAAILTYTVAATRRFDFNGSSASPTAAGFIGVLPTVLYSAGLGYGWQTAVLGFDRGAASGVTTTALYQDAAYGTAGPANAGTYEFQVVPGGTYGIRVYVGDQAGARSNITVTAEGGASVLVPPTAAAQFTSVTLTGVDVNHDGVITVTISEGTIGGFWVANGMDVALGGIGSLPGAAPELAAGGEAKGGGAGVAALTSAQLAPVVQTAIADWVAAGISTSQLALLRSTQFQIVTLGNGVLGQTGLGVPLVKLDATAAGYGWLIDPTNADFTASAGELLAKKGTPAVGHMDLLTVVEHELGHVLGLPDLNSSNDLMSETLAVGVRRLPDHVVAAVFASVPASKTPVIAGGHTA